MDSTSLIILILVQLLFLGAILFFIKKSSSKKEDSSSMVLLQNQVGELRNALDAKLGESHKSFQQQHGQIVSIVRDVTERLTRLDETNKQVISFADQLQSLQDILKNPK